MRKDLLFQNLKCSLNLSLRDCVIIKAKNNTNIQNLIDKDKDDFKLIQER